MNEYLLCWRQNCRQGYQNSKLQSFSQKINQKIKLLKVLFFQILQNFEWTITVLGEKHFGRVIKIENCSLRLKRSIKKPNFWKFSFFSNSSEFERTFTVLGEKVFGGVIKTEKCSFRLIRSIKKSNFWNISFFSTSSEFWTNNYRAWRKSFRQGYQNWKLQSSSHKINQKIKFLKVFSFFQSFQKFERTFNVLGEKFSGRDISIEKCTLCLQSIILKIKNFFESFVSFQFFRTWSMKFLDLWQQSFHPGCQKNFLGVHMSSIRDVGIRSDITWRETFFEPRLKNFDLFLKTAFCVSKGTFWVKKLFLKVLFLFQILENFERTFTVLGEKNFGRDIKNGNCSLRL